MIEPAARLEGELAVPGDKSISHRALLVSLLAGGSGVITGLSPAADVRSTAMALHRLSSLNPNLIVEMDEGFSLAKDFQIHLEGSGRALNQAVEPLDLENSGTSIRLLAGILAGLEVSAILTGDASLRSRPMGRVIHPLRAMGAQIEGAEGDLAPLRIVGRPLHGANHALDIASAQVKSCLLLAGLSASGETSVQEPTRSRDHTERLLRYLGVPIAEEANRLIVKSTNFRMADISVPGDLSSAAPLMAAAAICEGSDLRFSGVGLNPTRTGFLDVLRAYGAMVDVSDVAEVCGEPRGTVRVRYADRLPLTVDGRTIVEAIDEVPLVAVLGAFAEGTTVVTDAAELRVKESDRIQSIAALVRDLGGAIEPTPDGFVVQGRGGLAGGSVSSAGDHRIAMAAAVAATGAQGRVEVLGWDAVAVSYPGFREDLESVVVR